MAHASVVPLPVRRVPATALPRDGGGLDAAIILLVPFLEIGISYWASVASVAAALVLWRGRATIATGLAAAWPWALLVPLLFLPLLIEGSADPVQDGLRVAREGLVFVLLLVLVRGAPHAPVPLAPRLAGLLLAVVIGLLACALVEMLALRMGRYVGLPVDLYVQGRNTIPGALTLRYSQVRPAATYSEPSYLGFVMLSVLLLAGGLARSRVRTALIGVALACGAISRAASFLLSAAIVALAAARRLPHGRRRWGLYAALALGGALALVAGGEMGVVGRLSAGGSAEGDLSVFVRLVGPAQVLPDFLLAHPLGLPFAGLEDALAPATLRLGVPPDQYLQNGFYNLFFEFGLLGLPLAASLLAVRDAMLRGFLFCAMIFNGGFLAIDKLAMIGFAVTIYAARAGAR